MVRVPSQFVIGDVAGQGFLAEGLRRTSAGLGSVSFLTITCRYHVVSLLSFSIPLLSLFNCFFLPAMRLCTFYRLWQTEMIFWVGFICEIGQVIIDSQPLTVAVLASFFFGETLGPVAIVGLGLGVVGLVLLEVFLYLLGHYSHAHPQVHLCIIKVHLHSVTVDVKSSIVKKSLKMDCFFRY